MSRPAVRERPFQVCVRIDGRERMMHYDGHDCHDAIRKAQLAGYHVISAQKVDDVKIDHKFFGKWLGDVVEIQLEETHSALALEEIAFRRKKRIEQNKNDKESIDNE